MQIYMILSVIQNIILIFYLAYSEVRQKDTRFSPMADKIPFFLKADSSSLFIKRRKRTLTIKQLCVSCL